ncbi:MAG: GIY-YIG nuclease family protein [Thermoplasmata archaeon]|nr:MAG: GIY-YIG nuclease family protein [Thermoplasmata archaeon]
MKGSYALLIRLNKDTNIGIGAFMVIHFPKGYYMYIGSALNSIEGRVGRHLSNIKKVHWHIDYLLEKAEVSKVYYRESRKRTECSLADKFAGRFHVVPNFGSSDCRCIGHLFLGKKKELINCALKNGMKEFH